MSPRDLTRRAVLSALGAVALAPSVALAQGPLRLRNVRVDVGPLRASVGDPTAAWVEEALPGLLVQAFAPYLVPGDRYGAMLIARIDWLFLGPNHGTGPLGSSQDTIEGTLLVSGPRGVVAQAPLRAISNYFRSPVDQVLVVQSNQARILALAQNFAAFAPRQLGL
jgi:hypothetical protein